MAIDKMDLYELVAARLCTTRGNAKVLCMKAAYGLLEDKELQEQVLAAGRAARKELVVDAKYHGLR